MSAYTPEQLEDLARWLKSFGAYGSAKRHAAELLLARAAEMREAR